MAKKNEVKKVESKKSDGDNSVACSILAYFLVGIIWYFADDKMKKSAFAKFHVKQALVLLVLSIALSICVWILSMIFFFIPVIGWFVLAVLLPLLWLAYFIIWLFGVIYAATGKTKNVPVVGHFAEKLTF